MQDPADAPQQLADVVGHVVAGEVLPAEIAGIEKFKEHFSGPDDGHARRQILLVDVMRPRVGGVALHDALDQLGEPAAQAEDLWHVADP
jgi:hypothetical protein